MSEQMGIIKEIHIGTRDIGVPCLWFSVQLLNCGFLHVITGKDEIYDFMNKYSPSDIDSLNGKPCRARMENGMGTFLGLA